MSTLLMDFCQSVGPTWESWKGGGRTTGDVREDPAWWAITTPSPTLSRGEEEWTPSVHSESLDSQSVNKQSVVTRITDQHRWTPDMQQNTAALLNLLHPLHPLLTFDSPSSYSSPSF